MWAASGLKIYQNFVVFSFSEFEPRQRNNDPNPRSFYLLVGEGEHLTPETSPLPHWINLRATCLDVPDWMSLQFKIVYEK